jgi:Uma2 family endonuclease
VRHGPAGYAGVVSTAPRAEFVSVEDYLAGELESPIKHEYVGGGVYAMAGARNLHNTIEGNAFAYLHGRLRGQRSRPYNSNTKIRIRLPTEVRFYYPDTSVVCHPNAPTDSFQDEPVVIVEVLSQSVGCRSLHVSRAAILAQQGPARIAASLARDRVKIERFVARREGR